ncbi:MAG: glycosyl transferase family 36 [Bacteroidetes bacterium]|nr:glycosyl transferase family 36 [Bacteroidota bacterium]
MRTFKTKYGYFSDDGREYIITTPRTPRPWINVISNGDYGITISQTGSGYSWRTHAQLNRLTRWEQDLIKDEWGKYIYLRDEKGNVWSAGWKPICAEPKVYKCRHGIGYSIIESVNVGIETKLLIFVPNDEPLEVWQLTVSNRTRKTRKLNLYTYLEWGLGQAPDWHREFHKSFIETEYSAPAHAIFATKRLWEVPTERGHWNTNWPYVAFHSSSVKPVSYDGDKESFLGMYGNQAMPSSVKEKKLMRRTGNWLDPIASLQNEITLRPHEEKTICYTLGCADSREHAIDMIVRYRSEHEVEAALEEVHERWNGLLSTTEVSTPDDAMNVMQNVWLKYQAISGRMWGRTAYYQTGGAFGFRDQLQDSQLWLVIDPHQTKNQLRLHARHQFKDGSVYHWWHPISETGLRNQISDNLLWLPFVLNTYLQETNDFSVLDDCEPFVDDTNVVTMYDHCCRAIDRALDRFSDRGLPLIGGGDWNDGLSAVGLEMKGESIWLGHFIHRILLDFVDVATRLGDNARSKKYTIRAKELSESLNTLGWDGEYYYGATKDSGDRIGSKANSEGRVWLNPQTWAIIAGVANNERSTKVMDVVEKNLEYDVGPLLLYPAYKTPDKHVGYLTRYNPGVRENGGVYTHGATWAVVAAAMLGRGETAFRIYSKLNPLNRGKEPDRYCAEPYVTSGNIEGPDSAFFGRGGWTWYSGSATWLFKVGLEWILGVRGTVAGLVVDPCIPSTWKGFTVRRTFRGAAYNIVVKNPDHVQCGVKELWVDGERHCMTKGPRNKVVPVFEAGTTHEVVVVLGRE